MKACVQCRGVFVYGEPPWIMDLNGEDTLWCRDCIEYTSSCSWDDEQYGPYPFTVYQRPQPMRCDA
jgi:hypothetical protein